MANGAIYRVSASSLNLRDKPAPDGGKLGVMPLNALVTGLDGEAAPGWLKVAWNGLSGYASSSYLELQGAGGGGAVPGDGSAGPAAFGPAPPTSRRDQDLSKLHPIVRAAVSATLATLQGEGVPFRVFEAFRTPERQAALYAQGRTAPGSIVTKAQSWQSYHQYGLAVDLVLFRDNGWNWSDAGADAGSWTRMHEVAALNGLRHLDFETPHVEFDGPDWRRLQQGLDFPAGGDETWFDAVSEAAARWKSTGGAPAAPPIDPAQRPALPDAAPA